MLDNKLQAHFRILAAKKMKQIIASDSQNIAVKRQNYILNNINRKLDKGQAMITKADKTSESAERKKEKKNLHSVASRWCFI